MARTILGSGTSPLEVPSLTTRQNSPTTSLLSAKLIEDRLRQRRSSAYVAAMRKLDAGGHTHSREALDALQALIRSELPELSVDGLLVGIVSRCMLGSPYEVHTLSLIGTIIEHYKTFEPMPPLLERARALALHPAYAFIEVYSNRLVAVTDNGDPAIARGPE